MSPPAPPGPLASRVRVATLVSAFLQLHGIMRIKRAARQKPSVHANQTTPIKKSWGINMYKQIEKTFFVASILFANAFSPKLHATVYPIQTADEKLYKLTVGRPTFTITAEEAAHHQVKVLEPDGSVARQISVLPLSTHLDLLAWSKVRVKIVYGGRPLENMKVSCGTDLTSDMMFQTPDFSLTAVTDDSGIAEFDRFPPGESSIRINPQPAEFQGQKWVWLDQKKYVITVPGQQLEMTFGKGARDVVGQFVFDQEFDDGIQEYWGANLEYSSIRGNMGGNSETKFRIKILRNGSFIAESAPPGEAKIIIQHPGIQPKAGGFVFVLGQTSQSDLKCSFWDR